MARRPWVWLKTFAKQWTPIVTFVSSLLALVISVGALVISAIGAVSGWLNHGSDVAAFPGQWYATAQPQPLTSDSVQVGDTSTALVGGRRYRIDSQSRRFQAVLRVLTMPGD